MAARQPPLTLPWLNNPPDFHFLLREFKKDTSKNYPEVLASCTWRDYQVLFTTWEDYARQRHRHIEAQKSFPRIGHPRAILSTVWRWSRKEKGQYTLPFAHNIFRSQRLSKIGQNWLVMAWAPSRLFLFWVRNMIAKQTKCSSIIFQRTVFFYPFIYSEYWTK